LANALGGVALLRHEAFELIVVRDPSDLETSLCLAAHAPRARLADCAEANLAKARNIGLSMARGEIVAFLDDDAVPEPDWLNQLSVAYEDPSVAAAGGFIRARDGVKFQSQFVLIDAFGADHHRRRLPRRPPPGWFLALTGTNFSARRAAALAIGGFDENYAYFLDETDFLLRLHQAGGRIAVAPAAEVHHGYAANDMRDETGAPTSLRAIARSKAYFCHINRRDGTPAAKIARALSAFMRQKRRRIAAHRRAGRLGADDSERLLVELQSGLIEGEDLARRGRALPPPLTEVHLEFEPYPPPGAPPRRRLCILTAGAVADSAHWNAICSRAGAAFEVTVLAAIDAAKPRIGFQQGVWLHQMASCRFPFMSAARPLLAEMQRLAARRGFDVIHVASGDAALERVAAAAGLPRLTALPPARA
jgi:GT2 family glycosyltransferase